MNQLAKNIRPFIGAKNYEQSRTFYKALGFREVAISEKMCLFKINEELGFYLQQYYVRKWVQNSMIFIEVSDIDRYYGMLKAKELEQQFKVVKLSKINTFDWGRECFLHDPSGVLWHFCQFNE